MGRGRRLSPDGARLARSILVVDDEQILRELLVTMLEEAGHTVVAAEDGLDAAERVELICPRSGHLRFDYAAARWSGHVYVASGAHAIPADYLCIRFLLMSADHG